MRKMTSRLVLVAVTLAPTGGRAQSPAAPHAAPRDTAPRDTVATEVVLLRQAVEKLAVVAVKSQILASRLAAQQLRVVRDQDTIARAEDAIDAAGRRQELTRATLDRVNRALADVVQDPRFEAKREVENLTAAMEGQEQELTRLRTRLAQAQQSLRGEQQSYAELEKALGALVRDVERPKP